MIIIGIKSLPLQDHISMPEILIRINNAVAGILGCNPDSVRTYWELLKPGYDAVGSHAAAKVHEDSHSPIVTISAGIDYPWQKIDRLYKEIGHVFSTELGIDESNSLIVFNEIAPAMMHDGRKLAEA
jgi:hypothetical protein